MNTATSEILAVKFTPSREGDSPVLPDLLERIPQTEPSVSVTAGGASDTRRCHSAIIAHGGTAVISIRKKGRPWKADCPAARVRNESLRPTRHYMRAFWKHFTGSHERSRAEAKMRCLKSFGECIAARDPKRNAAETHIRVALITRFNALGVAESAAHSLRSTTSREIGSKCRTHNNSGCLRNTVIATPAQITPKAICQAHV